MFSRILADELIEKLVGDFEMSHYTCVSVCLKPQGIRPWSRSTSLKTRPHTLPLASQPSRSKFLTKPRSSRSLRPTLCSSFSTTNRLAAAGAHALSWPLTHVCICFIGYLPTVLGSPRAKEALVEISQKLLDLVPAAWGTHGHDRWLRARYLRVFRPRYPVSARQLSRLITTARLDPCMTTPVCIVQVGTTTQRKLYLRIPIPRRWARMHLNDWPCKSFLIVLITYSNLLIGKIFRTLWLTVIEIN